MVKCHLLTMINLISLEEIVFSPFTSLVENHFCFGNKVELRAALLFFSSKWALWFHSLVPMLPMTTTITFFSNFKKEKRGLEGSQQSKAL